MTTPNARLPIHFRGQSFIAMVLVPEAPTDEWLGHLDALAERSAGFFVGRPVILDVSRLTDLDADALKSLIEALRERSIRIMGLEGADAALLGPDLPPQLVGGRPAGELSVPTEALSRDAVPEAPRATPSLVVESHVRSGQIITFPEGDVTVLGSVSSGAEVIAGGSIHVYGALRGRALAGSTGNPDARIYCRKLEAEFLSIDGVFQTADDVETDLRGRSVQARLQDNRLAVAAIS